MKVHHSLICLFLWLQDGNTGLTDAEEWFYTGTVGGNITVKCSFRFHGKKKLFCRNECKGDDTLIETEDNNYHKGRYSIQYVRGATTEYATLSVSITDLNKSDSGWYGCGLERFGPDSYDKFYLRVTEAPTPPGPNLTPTPPGPNLTAKPPGPKLTPTPLSTSLPPSASPQTTGSSAPSSASVTTSQTETSPEGPDLLLYIGLVLVFMLAALSVAMGMFCRKRSRKHTEPPRETMSTGAMMENTEYAEIREDGRSRAAAVEETELYANVTHTTPTPVEDSDYNLVSGPAAVAPDNGEDVTYSDVNVVSSLHKTSAGPREAAVIYSAVAGQRSSPHPHHEAPDLYSTVAPH